MWWWLCWLAWAHSGGSGLRRKVNSRQWIGTVTDPRKAAVTGAKSYGDECRERSGSAYGGGVNGRYQPGGSAAQGEYKVTVGMRERASRLWRMSHGGGRWVKWGLLNARLQVRWLSQTDDGDIRRRRMSRRPRRECRRVVTIGESTT